MRWRLRAGTIIFCCTASNATIRSPEPPIAQAESYRVLAAQSEEKRARAEDELLTTARLVRAGPGYFGLRGQRLGLA